MGTVNAPTTSAASCDSLTGYDFARDGALPPRKAIRKFCEHCTGGQRDEVRNCTATPDECPFLAFRRGRTLDRSRDPNHLTPVKAIRRHCLICMGGDKTAVRECESTHCFAWPFRQGRNPNRAFKLRREAAFPNRQGENGPAVDPTVDQSLDEKE